MKIKLVATFFFIYSILFSNNYYKNYLVVYGEGPIGQHLTGDEAITFTKEEAINLAKDEIQFILSGMTYGFNFKYKVENKQNNRKGFFDIETITKIKIRNNKMFSYRQMQTSQMFIRIQGTYKLHQQQKDYINGFMMTSTTSNGLSKKYDIFNWNNRKEALHDSIKQAILSRARKKLKSRPLYITGKAILNEPPTFNIISGKWNVITNVGIIIESIEYESNY